jgi:Rrf2 family protein
MRGANGNNSNYMLLELSSKVEYALLALVELASYREQKSPLTINDLTAKQPIPDRYLEHIFTLLKRGGLIQSQRGAKGGYILAREPWQITLLEVITLVEGESKEREIFFTNSTERELIREVWKEASGASQTILSQCTLQDLCQRRNARKQLYPMYYI